MYGFRLSSLSTLERSMWFSSSTHWTSLSSAQQVSIAREVYQNWMPGDRCVLISFLFFLCLLEITAFSDRHSEFEKLNTEILGVSVDSVVSITIQLLYYFTQFLILGWHHHVLTCLQIVWLIITCVCPRSSLTLHGSKQTGNREGLVIWTIPLFQMSLNQSQNLLECSSMIR